MAIQKNTFQTLDLKWLILISIIIHVSILMYVKIDKQPVIKPAEINIVLEKIIEIPVSKKNIQPKVESIKKPIPIKKEKITIKPVEKLPEIAPVEPIEFDPIPDPVVQENDPLVVKEAVEVQQENFLLNDAENIKKQQKIIKNYGALLTQHISAFKKYPRIAQRRAWEGNILLEITLTKNSKILDIRIVNESKFNILNKEAVAMIERAQPLPKPNNIQSDTFKVLVPVAFKLR